MSRALLLIALTPAVLPIIGAEICLLPVLLAVTMGVGNASEVDVDIAELNEDSPPNEELFVILPAETV